MKESNINIRLKTKITFIRDIVGKKQLMLHKKLNTTLIFEYFFFKYDTLFWEKISVI